MWPVSGPRRLPRSQQQMVGGVSSISTFNTPRTVTGLVAPRGAHTEVGSGTQLGEAHDFFWGRRGAEIIEEGPRESGQFCPGLADFGGLTGWELLLGVHLGSQSKQWCWQRLLPWDYSLNTRFLPDLKAEKKKAWESGQLPLFSLFFSKIRFGLTACISLGLPGE